MLHPNALSLASLEVPDFFCKKGKFKIQVSSFVTDSQSIEAMFPKRNLTKYVENISINLAIHSLICYR